MTTPDSASVHHTPAAADDPSEGSARRMAAARHALAFPGPGDPFGWDHLLPSAQAAAELEARWWIRAAVNAGVTIVPPGRRAVDLPAPDQTSGTGASWTAGTDGTEFVVMATGRDGVVVTVDDLEVSVADLRAQCLAGLAACDYASGYADLLADMTADVTADVTAGEETDAAGSAGESGDRS